MSIAMNVSTDPIVIPVGGQMIPFGRLRPSDLFKVVEYANRCLYEDGLAAFKDAPLNERIEALRQLNNTYRYSDTDELLKIEKYSLYLLYCSYIRTHPGASMEDFRDIFSNTVDIATVTGSIDKLMWNEEANTPTEEVAESAIPPAVTEATTD